MMTMMPRKEVLYFLLAVLLQTCTQLATCGTTVDYLPGFEGPLPFHLETGYVGVGESEDVQVFYYFIKSEKKPQEDPLMLWISGVPGCSSLSSLIYEIGPIAFKDENYKGAVPNLELRQHSWTKECSIIFADLPVDAGFSYSRTRNSPRSDYELVHQAHQFLRKWLIEHPEYFFNQVYVGGNSYSGIIVPAIVQEISIGNGKWMQPWINLQGYTLGNPATTRKELDYSFPFAHGMGLISDELYMSWQNNCRKNNDSDSQNLSCSRDLDYFSELISGINRFNILEPNCEFDASPKPNEVSWRRRTLSEKFNDNFYSHLTLPPSSCKNISFLIDYWANMDDVHNALHVHQGSIEKWQRCNNQNYTYEIPNSIEYHANVSKKGYRSLIYSGDHDSVIPFMATEEWISALNYSIVDDWRPWLVKGQVAGFTRTYSNQVTYATVKGAGHLTSETKPEESLAMFNRWISNKPL